MLVSRRLVEAIGAKLSTDKDAIIAALSRRLDPEGKGIVVGPDELVAADVAGRVRMVHFDHGVGLLWVPSDREQIRDLAADLKAAVSP